MAHDHLTVFGQKGTKYFLSLNYMCLQISRLPIITKKGKQELVNRFHLHANHGELESKVISGPFSLIKYTTVLEELF